MNAELDTTYVRVCDLEDLAVGTPALADVDGIPMALVRTAPEAVHAVHDICTHANVSLSEGELDGCTLECWLHGSRFDLHTGAPSGPPATVPVAVYPVALIDGAVYVSTTPTASTEEHSS
jgi:3-phenylpropionate/trans-cinnamate dioxygenase ferredoxin subunit